MSAEAIEEAKLRSLDTAWAPLALVEQEALEANLQPEEVTEAVYKAAKDSALVSNLTIVDEDTFGFTVNGMHCLYDYVARNVQPAGDYKPSVDAVNDKGNGPTSADVLLVGPYYGYDGNFTDQYEQEAESIAAVTGGDVVILSGHAATGPAIAEAMETAGVVLWDSHGTQYGTSSYLCLTTNTGITSEDYAN
ncbi:MAG: hypothetical protein Q4B99_05395, partial [Clostridia bacterium]|nr:hypothetical protein [Clostridia bacterium]